MVSTFECNLEKTCTSDWSEFLKESEANSCRSLACNTCKISTFQVLLFPTDFLSLDFKCHLITIMSRMWIWNSMHFADCFIFLKCIFSKKSIKADFQSSHEAPRSSLRVLAWMSFRFHHTPSRSSWHARL
jgi:hypothetical protein